MTMNLKIPETSVEYLVAEITSPATVNPSWPVKMAVISSKRKIPAAGDWVNAEWDGNGVRVLVGPGTTLPLACGDYSVWVSINANPETAHRYAGSLTVV